MLTEYVEGAVAEAQRAARAADLPQVPAEYLLAGLLKHSDSHAAQLVARLGIEPELAEVLPEPNPAILAAGRPEPLPELEPAANRALLEGSVQAGRAGDRWVGTEHLLLGLATDAGSRVGKTLREAGADPETLWEAIRELRADQEQDRAPMPAGDHARQRMPLAVVAVSLLMVMHLTCGLLFFPTALYYGPLLFRHFSDPLAVPRLLLLASWLWTSLGCAVLMGPLLRRRRWAWASTQSALFAKATSALGLTAFSGMGPEHSGWLSGTRVWWLGVLCTTALLLATWRLFRARGWFGVGPREGWRTMRKWGGWALVVTGLLDLGCAATLALNLK